MSEPRKPIFGFLWPKPDLDAPVDGAYRQLRMVRLTSRGPVRVLTLAVGSVLTVAILGTALMAGLAAGLSAATVVGAAIAATALVLLLRGWVVGTYVNDAALTVETLWRRRTLPWSDVAGIAIIAGPVPFLGLPVRIAGSRCVVQLRDGSTVATHLYTASPDLWLRPEAFDMAATRLQNWFERA